MRSRLISGNKKPIITKYPDVNRALQDIYDSINKLTESVNGRKKVFERYKGLLGDLRVNDEGFQYHNGKDWQTLAITGSDSGDDLPPVVASSFQGPLITSGGGVTRSLSIEAAKQINLSPKSSGRVSIESDLSQKPELLIKGTYDDNKSPMIKFLRDTGSAASVSDGIGRIEWYGDNAAQEETVYAKIATKIAVPIDTDEAGIFQISVASSNGTTSSAKNGITFTGAATTNIVNTEIGYGVLSTTTIAGDLDIDGNEITSAGALEIDAGGDVTITGQDVAIDTTKKLYFDGGGNTYIYEAGTDNLKLVVGSSEMLSMVESGPTGNYVLAIDSPIGFNSRTPAYDAADTNVYFRTTPRIKVTFGAGNITDLNLFFPNVDCHCQLLLVQDGTGSRTVTNWKTFDESNGNESTVSWAGGSAPTLTTTADKMDIITFFWDNTAHKAYGAIIQNFTV